jgi:hypothetical protein
VTAIGLRYNAWSRSALGKDFTDAADLSANTLELFFDAFITAVHVIDTVNDGFTVGNQSGDDQRR